MDRCTDIFFVVTETKCRSQSTVIEAILKKWLRFLSDTVYLMLTVTITYAHFLDPEGGSQNATLVVVVVVVLVIVIVVISSLKNA